MFLAITLSWKIPEFLHLDAVLNVLKMSLYVYIDVQLHGIAQDAKDIKNLIRHQDAKYKRSEKTMVNQVLKICHVAAT